MQEQSVNLVYTVSCSDYSELLPVYLMTTRQSASIALPVELWALWAQEESNFQHIDYHSVCIAELTAS